MLIELIEIFLGAFNNYFSVDDSNYVYFSQIIVVAVCIIAFTASCVLLCIIVHDILKFLSNLGGRWH